MNECGHGRSIFSTGQLFLTVTHSWFRYHIRCHECDLDEVVGWRLPGKRSTQGDILQKYFRERNLCRFGGNLTSACYIVAACGCQVPRGTRRY